MTARQLLAAPLASLLRALAVMFVLVVAGAVAVAPAEVDAASLADVGSTPELVEDDDNAMIAGSAAPDLSTMPPPAALTTPRLARPAHAPATPPPDPPPRP